MKTLSYVLGSEREIVKGGEYYFGQLWDGNGESERGKELLESGSICVTDEADPDESEIFDFNIIEPNEDILQTVVKIL